MAEIQGRPLRVGDRFSGAVRDLSSSGDGVVAHANGQVFFVPGVWTGEAGEFQITAFKGRSGTARLLTLLEPSPWRVEPPCPHHGFERNHCGGCAWQFVAYEQQLQAKQERLRRALVGLDDEEALRPIWGSPETLGYRNRAQLKSDGRRLGFVARGSNDIASIDDCLVLNTANRKTLAALVARLPNRDWQAERRKTWTTLDIDDEIDEQAVVPNLRRPFRQGNSAQNRRMQAWLAEQLREIGPGGPVLELFAGSGNFTEVLADATPAAIIAIDSFAPAVHQLEQRSLPGVVTRVLNLSRAEAAGEIARQLADAELLVLDPPREGLRHSEEFLRAGKKLRNAIYISCDLATFVRDCRHFLNAGFRLIELQPLDMFPHTPHIETLALLRR